MAPLLSASVYPQEIAVLYSGSSPASFHINAFLSSHLLGSRAFELYRDIDCPRHGSVWFDFVHYVHGRPTVFRRAACAFEQTRGAPLRRRRYREQRGTPGDGGYYRVEGLSDNCLVVRTVLVMEHYEYIVDFVFHQNGVIETVVSVSGYTTTFFYAGPAEKQANKINGYEAS